MNKTSPFIFNGKIYYVGTIIRIKEEYKQYVGFNSILKFSGYIIDENVYCFSSLQDKWKIYKIPSNQIAQYIENILSEGVIEDADKRIDPKYIDGIVSAWIWYILVMFFAVFVKEPGNTITVWILATFIFFRWRHIKIKGG